MMDANETDSILKNDSYMSHKRSDAVDWSRVTPYRGWMPPDHNDGWTMASISRRFVHGTRAETTVERSLRDNVTLGDPHWYVTITRDQFPQSKRPTTEYEHDIVPETSALAAWFGDNAEIR